MGKLGRVRNVFAGIFMILLSFAMLAADPEDSFLIAAVILSLALLFTGISRLAFYFAMARYMVGGKTQLYVGLIVLDFGVFTLMLTEMPHIYMILYLLGTHAFSGGVDILRSLEAKRNGASSWKLKVSQGAVNIIIAVLCLFSLGSIRLLVILYCLGLMYSAVVRIISAFRKTAIVYIQ